MKHGVYDKDNNRKELLKRSEQLLLKQLTTASAYTKTSKKRSKHIDTFTIFLFTDIE